MIVYTSLAVFLFSAIALIIPSGFSVGASLLVLGSVVLLWQRAKPQLRRDDYLLMAAFAAYFFINAAVLLTQAALLREYDAPLRFLLALPALLLLLAYPPRAAAFWGGLAAGAIGAGVYAFDQILPLGVTRAGGSTNPIQFGNISILFAILCLAGLAWAAVQPRRRAWTALLLLGAVCGTAASIFTASRGSWIALPVCASLLAFQHAGSYGKRLGIGFVVLLTLMAGVYALPQSGVRARTELAEVELQRYFVSGDADTSVGTRLELWRSGIAMVAEHPLLGWSKQGYMDHKAELIKAGKVAAVIGGHTHLHNEYLDALVKHGAAGLLALLALYLVPLGLFAQRLRRGDDKDRIYAAAGVALCVSYMLFGLTQAFLTHNNGVMTFAFLTIMLWACPRRVERLA